MYQKGNLVPPAPSRSPQTSPNWSIMRKSKKAIKKKNISAPETQSVIHISGAKMIGTKMTIVDNTGLLDPRVRKFLAIAGKFTKIIKCPELLETVLKQFPFDLSLFSLLSFSYFQDILILLTYPVHHLTSCLMNIIIFRP